MLTDLIHRISFSENRSERLLQVLKSNGGGVTGIAIKQRGIVFTFQWFFNNLGAHRIISKITKR